MANGIRKFPWYDDVPLPGWAACYASVLGLIAKASGAAGGALHADVTLKHAYEMKTVWCFSRSLSVQEVQNNINGS